jgi:DNA end-binding protein Ku
LIAIRHRRVCDREQREVPPEEIRRGWEAPDGRTVVLDAGDLDALPLPSKRTAEVLGFVDDDDVDSILYDRPYWVGPNGDAAQRPYALLVEALARHGTIAVWQGRHPHPGTPRDPPAAARHARAPHPALAGGDP